MAETVFYILALWLLCDLCLPYYSYALDTHERGVLRR